MSRLSVCAYEDARLQISPELPPPQFKGPRGNKFEIIEMRVNVQNLHARILAGKVPFNDLKMKRRSSLRHELKLALNDVSRFVDEQQSWLRFLARQFQACLHGL